jgi:hypothetical protein
MHKQAHARNLLITKDLTSLTSMVMGTEDPPSSSSSSSSFFSSLFVSARSSLALALAPAGFFSE